MTCLNPSPGWTGAGVQVAGPSRMALVLQSPSSASSPWSISVGSPRVETRRNGRKEWLNCNSCTLILEIIWNHAITYPKRTLKHIWRKQRTMIWHPIIHTWEALSDLKGQGSGCCLYPGLVPLGELPPAPAPASAAGAAGPAASSECGIHQDSKGFHVNWQVIAGFSRTKPPQQVMAYLFWGLTGIQVIVGAAHWHFLYPAGLAMAHTTL